jgi:hypothetical protein
MGSSRSTTPLAKRSPAASEHPPPPHPRAETRSCASCAARRRWTSRPLRAAWARLSHPACEFFHRVFMPCDPRAACRGKELRLLHGEE